MRKPTSAFRKASGNLLQSFKELSNQAAAHCVRSNGLFWGAALESGPREQLVDLTKNKSIAIGMNDGPLFCIYLKGQILALS